ncbi:unnamed protein product, partial [Musa textilis]
PELLPITSSDGQHTVEEKKEKGKGRQSRNSTERRTGDADGGHLDLTRLS